MKKFTWILAGLALVALPACKKEKPNTSEGAAPVTSPATTEAPPPPAPPPPETKSMSNNMANCPSAVPGARTAVAKEAATVVVTITAGDDASVAEIRKRAKLLEGFSGKDSDEVKHTAKGTGSGVLGKCPVALAEASARAEDVDRGAKVTLTPKDAAKLDALFSMVNQRAGATDPPAVDADPPSGDHGGGGGQHEGGGGGMHRGGGGGNHHGGETKEPAKKTKEPSGSGW